MSLILDALNRASKDKAAAAAVAPAEATVAGPGNPPVSLPDPLAPDLLASTVVRPDVAPATAWPALALSLAPIHSAPALPIDASGAASAMEPVEAEIKLTTEPQPPAPSIQPETRPESSVASAPQPKVEQPPPSGGKSVPRDAPRVAKTILRAKASGPQAGKPKRLIVLAGVAALLAAGLGSVMLGWWGDPMAWLQTGGLQGPSSVQPAARATAVEPAAAAAVAPQAVASDPSRVQALVQTPEMSPGVDRQRANPRATAVTRRADSVPQEGVSGLVLSERKAPNQPKPAAAPGKSGQPVLQSRSTGPSALELGYTALTQGRLQEAMQAYTQALAGNPEERDALLGLAYIAHQQGREEDTRAYYKRVLRQEPGNPVARAGLLMLSPTDDENELGSRSREVAEQNPDSAAAQSVLGHGLVRQGRLADAQQAFYRAHLLEPGVALHAFNLAVALDRLRNYAPARLYYERAMTLSAQSGGERASGVPHSVVQARLEQLRVATVANPPGSR